MSNIVVHCVYGGRGISDRERFLPPVGMTEKKVDFQSTLLEPLGFEPRVVQ